MTKLDEIRVRVFRKRIMKEGWSELLSFSDEQLLQIMNATVIPNAFSINAVKNTVLFYFIFEERTKRKLAMVDSINRLISLASNLTKTEKVIIKFGVVNGFESKNWRQEMFRYINNPVALFAPSQGRKSISSRKFKEIFFFAYNLIKRGENNARPPKF